MERNHRMAAIVLPPRKAYIPDHTDQPAAGHKSTVAVSPHLVELFQEIVVVLDVSHLAVRIPIFLERPVWGRRHHQMDALRLDCGHLPGVAEMDPMRSRDLLNGILNQAYQLFILRDSRKIRLRILQRKQLSRDETGEVEAVTGDLQPMPPCRSLDGDAHEDLIGSITLDRNASRASSAAMRLRQRFVMAAACP